MTLDQKQKALQDELGRIKDSQQRFAEVVARGRRHGSFDPAWRREEFAVEGCLSRLWIVPEFREGKCFFHADSDSAIVKGITSLICDFYSGAEPDEILSHDLTFLTQLGITQHLSANRRNSLGRVGEIIRAFAASHLKTTAQPR